MQPTHNRRVFGRTSTVFYIIAACSSLLLLATGCLQGEIASLWATQTPTVTVTPTSTATPTATPTPTMTPTPGPLTPAQIFDQVSPSVVFIDTPAGTGSGALIADNYIVTNAHVVWPFDQVRIVLANGTEYPDVPVVNWDLMGDLAVVGPLDVDLPPLELVDGEGFVIGSDVYLIGYPGEVDEFPEPTITRGLISRMREWKAIQVTFFQTDATIAGGQSGGVLVSDRGNVIGISGYTFSEGEFGLIASAADIMPRIKGLIAGRDVDGLGDRRWPTKGGKLIQTALLLHEWDSELYVINEPVGTRVEIQVNGNADGAFSVHDARGYTAVYADETTTGAESDTFEIELDAPYVLDVFQDFDRTMIFNVSSSHNLVPYKDRDDGTYIKLGTNITGCIDYRYDYDTFKIVLDKGETINIVVDSILINPYVFVGQPGDDEAQIVDDDDTGGGLFGTDAELTFQAPHDGAFYIVISDAYNYQTGGYRLIVQSPYDGAPTPVVPQPTPTPVVVATELGEMMLYQSPMFPFELAYPAEFRESGLDKFFETVCSTVPTCMGNEWGVLAIIEEDLASYGIEWSLEEYVDVLVANLEKAGPSSFSREVITTEQGLPAELLTVKSVDGEVTFVRFIALYERIAFSATYIIRGKDYESNMALVQYSINSFHVTDLE